MTDFAPSIASAETAVKQAQARLILIRLGDYAQKVTEAFPHVVSVEFSFGFLDEPAFDEFDNQIDDFSVRRFLRQAQAELDEKSGLPLSGFLKFHYEKRRVTLESLIGQAEHIIENPTFEFSAEGLAQMDDAMSKGAAHRVSQ